MVKQASRCIDAADVGSTKALERAPTCTEQGFHSHGGTARAGYVSLTLSTKTRFSSVLELRSLASARRFAALAKFIGILSKAHVLG